MTNYNEDELKQKVEIGENFLKNNSTLSSLDLPDLKKVDGNFSLGNIQLENLNLPEDLNEILSEKTEEKHTTRGRR